MCIHTKFITLNLTINQVDLNIVNVIRELLSDNIIVIIV